MRSGDGFGRDDGECYCGDDNGGDDLVVLVIMMVVITV